MRKQKRTVVEVIARERGHAPEVLKTFKFKNKGLAKAYVNRWNKHHCPPVKRVPDYYAAAYIKTEPLKVWIVTKRIVRHPNMRNIPISEFGRDHWSLLAYIETLCVDHREGFGVPDRDNVRCNVKQHPGLIGPRVAMAEVTTWKDAYSTRLRGHTKEKPNQMSGHDDWNCAYDLEEAGLIEDHGTGINPRYKMTTTGHALAAALRAHKASGGNFSNFLYENKQQKHR